MPGNLPTFWPRDGNEPHRFNPSQRRQGSRVDDLFFVFLLFFDSCTFFIRCRGRRSEGSSSQQLPLRQFMTVSDKWGPLPQLAIRCHCHIAIASEISFHTKKLRPRCRRIPWRDLPDLGDPPRRMRMMRMRKLWRNPRSKQFCGTSLANIAVPVKPVHPVHRAVNPVAGITLMVAIAAAAVQERERHGGWSKDQKRGSRNENRKIHQDSSEFIMIHLLVRPTSCFLAFLLYWSGIMWGDLSYSWNLDMPIGLLMCCIWRMASGKCPCWTGMTVWSSWPRDMWVMLLQLVLRRLNWFRSSPILGARIPKRMESD